ncbi:MAG: glycosyltransferase family 4 protein [Promethearchaeota archaeon]
MKITFVTSHLTLYGGGGIFVQNYANALAQKGHKINVVAQKVDRSKYYFRDEIKVFEIGGALPSNPFHWLEFHHIIKKYIKVINQLDTEILFSQYFPSNYICAKARKKEGLKHVYYCHEPFRYFHDKVFYSTMPIKLRIIISFLRVFFKRYDIKGARDADIITCNSKFTKNRVKKTYNREGIVHYQGVQCDLESINDNQYSPHPINSFRLNFKYIFALGLSHHLKGARELLMIFNSIIKEIPNIRLIIGGTIEKQNKLMLKKMIRQLRIPRNKIIFKGFIPNSELDFYYSNSLITLFTAKDEAYGYIPLESMKNGTPVVAFEGGPSETIVDGITGFVIKKDDIRDFARKVIEIIKNPELRAKLSKNAQSHVFKNFNFKKSVENLEKILLNVY